MYQVCILSIKKNDSHYITAITNLLKEGNIVLSDNLFINKKVCQLNFNVLFHINMSLCIYRNLIKNDQGSLALHIGTCTVKLCYLQLDETV